MFDIQLTKSVLPKRVNTSGHGGARKGKKKGWMEILPVNNPISYEKPNNRHGNHPACCMGIVNFV